VIQGTYVLQPGQDVHSNRMRLVLQTDGNLVLHDEHDSVVWATGTQAAGTHVVFQGDGNFVLYSSTDETLWSSRTDGHNGAVLVLRANGDMAIVQGDTVLWHTNTAK
jgi:D-mannose binding lectin